MKDLDILKPKLKDEILKSLEGKDPDDILIRSIRNNFLSGVKYALEQGANIHYVNDYALIYATEYGYLDITKYLVRQGADIHALNDYALRWAAEKGRLEIANYLKKQMTKENR